jgi:hypothetical protein
MSYIKNALDEILFCSICNGQGYLGWANEIDFSFESCECNPFNLIIENEMEVMK